MKTDQQKSALAYLPAHDWKKLLESSWATNYELIKQGNYDEIASFLRNFFRNEGISGFWGDRSMFQTFLSHDFGQDVNRAELLLQQFAAWKQYVPNVQLCELDAPRIGNPWVIIVTGAGLATTNDLRTQRRLRLAEMVHAPLKRARRTRRRREGSGTTLVAPIIQPM